MPTIRFVFMVLTAILLGLSAVPGRAEDPPRKETQEPAKVSGEVKEAGKELAEDTKAAGRELKDSKLGRYVEDAAHELGRDISGASKQGWEKSKSFSASAADEVKKATREFWDDVIRTKEAILEKLRSENADLKKKDSDERRSESAKEAR